MKESMKQMGILGDDDDDDSDDDESSSEGDDHLSIPSDVSLTNSEISDLKKHDFTKIDITVMKNLHAELQEKGMPAVLAIMRSKVDLDVPGGPSKRICFPASIAVRIDLISICRPTTASLTLRYISLMLSFCPIVQFSGYLLFDCNYKVYHLYSASS